MPKTKPAQGATYHGYEALRTSSGTWQDTGRQRSPIDIYRTEIRTPYSLGIDEDDLSRRMEHDLADQIPEIRIYSKQECDRRAFDVRRPYLIGCQAIKDWRADRWLITIITREDFTGFAS